MEGTLLLEILTEELPTRAVSELSAAGAEALGAQLQSQQLPYTAIHRYATPRRLAWRVDGLRRQQPTQRLERKGPALGAAQDSAGQWSKAALGFAQSCGVAVDELEQRDGHLYFQREQPGRDLAELFPAIFAALTEALPIAKRMRWGSNEQSFVRPVLSLLALYNEEILPLEYFGLRAGNQTLGHRVHGPGPLTIAHPDSYLDVLRDNGVLADPAERRRSIQAQIEALAEQQQAVATVEEALLDEVTALVEWPVALLGDFEPEFLRIPAEVLITTMRDNQKTFPLFNSAGALLPHFIAIANLRSRDEALVKKGNEKVIRPRFADAQFFWEQDLKRPLADYLPRLAAVSYQAKLGTLADKVARLEALTAYLGPLTGADPAPLAQAARLSKSDLLSEMVMEFPELQGVMGAYYAEAEGLGPTVAAALREQYQPLGAQGSLPRTREGLALALAEKVDVLVGGFALGAKPSGSKDPYGLRRNAIALIRLIIENELSLDLKALLERSASLFPAELAAEKVLADLREYIIERLEHYYSEQNIASEIYQAVKARELNDLLDFDRRIKALNQFVRAGAAEILLACAKRIRNILRKNGRVEAPVEAALLVEPAEKELFVAFQQQESSLNQALNAVNYGEALHLLGTLDRHLDSFFTHVMVMSEDKKLQKNRLALLTLLQNKFDLVADLSLI